MTNIADNLSVNDFGKVCRTCLAEGEMKFLYKNCSTDVCLLEMLMTVTFVQFAEKDGLPLQICLKCEKEVIRSYKFAKKCSEVDKKLRNCLNELQNKIHNKTNAASAQTENIVSEVSTDYPVKENRLENTEIKQETSNEREENSSDINFEVLVIKPENLPQNDDEHNYSDKQTVFDEKSTQNLDKNDSDDENSDRNDDAFAPSDNSDSDYKTNDKSSDYNQEEGLKNSTKQKKSKFGPPYECKRCFEVFPNFKILKLHWKEVKHPPNSRTNCKICSKSIYCSKVNQHMKTHTSEQAFGCDICGKRFNIRTNLNRHKMIHSGEKPHKCPHCDKAFIQTFHLNVHLRTHTGELPFSCGICNKRFATKTNVKLHSRVHEGRTGDPITDLPFECEICQQSFKSKEILKNHKVIHGEKRFLCSECGRGFFSNAALLSHSYVHTGLKPLTCETCGKKFRHLSTLNNHKLLHTGDKPFLCTICNRRFTQRHHLTYHLRTHSGEKPYSCTFCDKSFALNNNLKVHMRTHTGETPYLCPICGKGFYDSSSMKKHKLGHVTDQNKKVM